MDSGNTLTLSMPHHPDGAGDSAHAMLQAADRPGSYCATGSPVERLCQEGDAGSPESLL